MSKRVWLVGAAVTLVLLLSVVTFPQSTPTSATVTVYKSPT